MRTIGLLLRQRARRDAVSLAVWLAGLAALAAAGYPGVRGSYGDEQERVALLGTVMANPVVLLFRGLPSGAGEAQMVAFLLLPWLLLLVALMCSFLAVRHTRGDEEDGRLELVSATAVGRTAPLVATALHGVGASIVAGAVVAVIFVASGAPPVGAALIAAGCTLAGTVSLGVGLVSAELMPTSRAANALAVWLVVGTFVLAGAGNALGTPSADLTRMTSSALAWFSPFGWAENTRPFDTDEAWPLAASVLATLVLFGGAALLHARRDLGASFVPLRTGRAATRPGFATHLALTVRQSRAAGIGWIVAGLFVGILSTSLAGIASRIGEGNPAVTSLLQALSGTSADLSRGLIVVFFVMLGITNVQAMVPFVRTVGEGHAVVELLAENGLRRSENDLKVIMMCELPSNALLADRFLEFFDGFSIGSNDMTQLTLGLDRDSGLVASTFDERDPAVLRLLSMAISACRAAGKYVGICGQGPSDHPDLAEWLVAEGIESVSLNPDTVVETWLRLSRTAVEAPGVG